MKKILVIAAIVVISASLLLFLGGCTQRLAENLVEKAIENAAQKDGQDVDINLDEGEVNITDEEGNEFSLGSATVPEGWPSSVPVNDKIKIEFSSSGKTDNKSNWSISGTFNGSAEDLYNYYKQQLAGWNVDTDSVVDSGEGGKSYTLQTSNDKYTVFLFVNTDNEKVAVILNVGEK